MESYSFIGSNAVWPCWPDGVILASDVGNKTPGLQKDVYLCVSECEIHEFENLGLAFLIILLPKDILLTVREVRQRFLWCFSFSSFKLVWKDSKMKTFLNLENKLILP